jgi:hypothetical protein
LPDPLHAASSISSTSHPATMMYSSASRSHALKASSKSVFGLDHQVERDAIAVDDDVLRVLFHLSLLVEVGGKAPR